MKSGGKCLYINLFWIKLILHLQTRQYKRPLHVIRQRISFLRALTISDRWERVWSLTDMRWPQNVKGVYVCLSAFARKQILHCSLWKTLSGLSYKKKKSILVLLLLLILLFLCSRNQSSNFRKISCVILSTHSLRNVSYFMSVYSSLGTHMCF